MISKCRKSHAVKPLKGATDKVSKKREWEEGPVTGSRTRIPPLPPAYPGAGGRKGGKEYSQKDRLCQVG